MSDNDLVLRIPHNLGAAEAKRRIGSGVDAARSQYGRFLRDADVEWDANRMNFRVTALAQTVQGSVEIEERFVELRAQLPMMIRLLAKRFVPVVKGTGQKLLK
jgi:hypothetical protein